ncbi:MAG: thiolase family protein [Dehalococcoidia bacterium]|nr:thiolase family protein [Dehalococcoidia bacterium]
MSLRGKAAIAGLGITAQGRIFGRDSSDFAAEAIKLALEDAGLRKDELDGLLINSGVAYDGLSVPLQNTLGLRNIRLLNHMNAHGATAGAMVKFAALAIEAGMADVVACVFADAAVKPTRSGSAAYAKTSLPAGMASLTAFYGHFGAATARFSLAARRHMDQYGTTSKQFGEIAVAERAWAVKNPLAQMRTSLTIEDHQNSRYICDPFRLLDCCLVSNGGVAVIVTSAERARTLKQPPVYILGMGEGHPGDPGRADWDPSTQTGAAVAKETAFKMAGVSLSDIDLCQIYDCYTYTVLVTLEDYGFCEKGEGGPFVEDGKLGPGGSLPTNTGGGQLSAYYMWGMTPLSEAVIQVRGQAGERQVKKHELTLVTGNGGTLAYHSTLILGSHS